MEYTAYRFTLSHRTSKLFSHRTRISKDARATNFSVFQFLYTAPHVHQSLMKKPPFTLTKEKHNTEETPSYVKKMESIAR